MYSCAIALLIQPSYLLLLIECKIGEDWPQGRAYVDVKPPPPYWPVF